MYTSLMSKFIVMFVECVVVNDQDHHIFVWTSLVLLPTLHRANVA